MALSSVNASHPSKCEISSAEKTNFEYQSLGPREIRLLVLLPGSWDAKIECNLVHVPLELAEFDALSYTWGDINDTTQITLGGHIFKITIGLERALRHFRLPADPLRLWVDAICIDQSNISERNVQVQMMYSIYQKSQTVRSWIGRETEDDDAAIREKLMDKAANIPALNDERECASPEFSKENQIEWNVAKLLESFGSPYTEYLVQYNEREEVNTYGEFADDEASNQVLSDSSEANGSATAEDSGELKESFEQNDEMRSMIEESLETRSGLYAWVSLATLCTRPYWKRVWIQQELMETSKVKVHYGRSSFNLLSLSALFEVTLELYINGSDDQRSRSCQAFSYFSAWCNFAWSRTSVTLASQEDGEAAILNFQFFRKSTDARDKIYALVGLIPSWRDGKLPVDYNLPAARVYMIAFEHTTATTGNLMVLVYQLKRPKTERLADLPSWCPDWSQDFNYAPGDFDEIPIVHLQHWIDSSALYVPRQSISVPASFIDGGKGLVARGHILDVVENVVETFNPSKHGPYLQSKLFEESLELALRYCGGPYWTFWRTSKSTPPDSEKHQSTADFDKAKITMSLTKEQINSRLSNQLVSFWSTVIGEGNPHYKRFPGEAFNWIGSTDLASSSSIVMKEDILKKAKEISESYDEKSRDYKHGKPQPHLRNCCFFMSHGKYMGRSADEVRKGDLICALFGTNIPVLLRPVDNSYIFIGPVFFYGWMTASGRAYKVCKEEGRENLEFTIY